MSKTLVAYYSRAGQNYAAGDIVNLPKGNTELLAEAIADALGADLFQIDTVQDYPEDYFACTDQAKRELREKARPELKESLGNADAYDTIFLGYPNWWGTCPMCVFTFLEGLDLAGKRIVPFCTNEGSGMGGSERQIAQACPGATVERGLSITGNRAAQSKEQVVSWARKFA